MSDAERQNLPLRWKLAQVGALVGELAGFLAGPLTIFAVIHLFHGKNPGLFGLVVSPVLGGFLGALEGMALGAIWPLATNRHHRLTITRMMLIIAIAGIGLALIATAPVLAYLILGNALLVFPVVVVALFAFIRLHDRETRPANKSISTNRQL